MKSDCFNSFLAKNRSAPTLTVFLPKTKYPFGSMKSIKGCWPTWSHSIEKVWNENIHIIHWVRDLLLATLPWCLLCATGLFSGSSTRALPRPSWKSQRPCGRQLVKWNKAGNIARLACCPATVTHQISPQVFARAVHSLAPILSRTALWMWLASGTGAGSSTLAARTTCDGGTTAGRKTSGPPRLKCLPNCTSAPWKECCSSVRRPGRRIRWKSHLSVVSVMFALKKMTCTLLNVATLFFRKLRTAPDWPTDVSFTFGLFKK